MRVILHFAAVIVLTAFTACSRHEPVAIAAPGVKHEHHAPHGGTPVVLGNEACHLEFVREADAGRLTVYVLDAEMEEFLRVKAATFEVVATVGGTRQRLTFRAVANAATGETVGNTSQFEAQADWLKTTASFHATLSSLEIKGTAFSDVPFDFPKGNDRD